MSATLLNLIGETDATVWAREFVRVAKQHPNLPVHETTMTTWFACAIEAGRGTEPVTFVGTEKAQEKLDRLREREGAAERVAKIRQQMTEEDERDRRTR